MGGDAASDSDDGGDNDGTGILVMTVILMAMQW